ncbi:RNA polymerase subunit sigma [Halarcobacter mediterraneus]|uniref:RNA polymerase subunit sigma n=1 Tax=Halarcobacter mediterraneus TaxID=2023153 RepID=A0A4Q1AZN5_9BACT|nr:RNA polymerase sigma factor [Halarcobacter mediterraneus]RXK14480.1 RNA polymerase subunit sigma [Halarcobacter mediterraneus]
MTTYYKEIFLYVKKNISDTNLANDITQEAFARVINAKKNTKIENERAFLYKVTKNLIIEHSRKDTKTKEISYEEEKHLNDTYETEKEYEQHKQKILLKKALQQLPKQRRQIFILYIIDGYSREEIAKMQKISMNSINLHISRASVQLKEIIKELEEK